MTDLPEGLQQAYDALKGVLDGTMMATRDYEAATAAVEALVAPYRTAQKAYAGSHGVYVVGPAYLVRIDGQKAEGAKGKQGWHVWPDDRPMPSVLDLLMLAHEKNDPAKSLEDT